MRGRLAAAAAPARQPSLLAAQGAETTPRNPEGIPESRVTSPTNHPNTAQSPQTGAGNAVVGLPSAPGRGDGQTLAAAVGASGGSREPRETPSTHPLFPSPDEPANPNRVFGPPNRPASSSARRDRNFWPLSGIRLVVFFCKRERRYKKKLIPPFGGHDPRILIGSFSAASKRFIYLFSRIRKSYVFWTIGLVEAFPASVFL